MPVLGVLGYPIGCAIIGGLVGQVITFALNLGQQPEPAQKRRPAPDPITLRRRRLLAECETLEQLISQAEKDGDNEVLTKLATYRAKLKDDLAF